jgi:hypothetical protein
MAAAVDLLTPTPFMELTSPSHRPPPPLTFLLVCSYKYKEYGLKTPFVAEELIRQFFAYWWPTPVGSPQRSKVMFSIKRGPLAGKAVAIIVNEGPACKDKTPSALAAYRGSSLFVYHQVGAAPDTRDAMCVGYCVTWNVSLFSYGDVNHCTRQGSNPRPLALLPVWEAQPRNTCLMTRTCVLLLHPPFPQAAAADFRAKVLAPMFADIAKNSKFWGRSISFDMAAYIKTTEALAAKQLTYTLENLPPADSVGLFKVAFKTSAEAAAGASRAGTGIVDEKGGRN